MSTCSYTPDYNIIAGVDCARFGDDKSVIAVRDRNEIIKLLKYTKLDTMQLAYKVAEVADLYRACQIYIDVIGIGSGVVDRLFELNYPIIPINVGERSFFPQKFKNLRAELLVRLKNQLNPTNNDSLKLPNDMELRDELANIIYEFDESGRLKIEKKDKMKEKIGRSPDSMDAIMLTVLHNFNETVGGTMNIEPVEFNYSPNK